MEYRVWSIYILHSLYVCTCKHKFHCGNIYTLISRVYKILEEHGPKSLYGVECCVWSEKAMAPHSSLLPGKSHGRWSLVGCSSWGRKESDTTERLHFDFHRYKSIHNQATKEINFLNTGTTNVGFNPLHGFLVNLKIFKACETQNDNLTCIHPSSILPF